MEKGSKRKLRGCKIKKRLFHLLMNLIGLKVDIPANLF
jgi:hypothetical protein